MALTWITLKGGDCNVLMECQGSQPVCSFPLRLFKLLVGSELYSYCCFVLSEPWRRSQGGGTSTAEEHDSVNPGGGLRVVVLATSEEHDFASEYFF